MKVRIPLKCIAMTTASVMLFGTVFSLTDIVGGAGSSAGQLVAAEEQGSQKSAYAEKDVIEWWKADLSAYDDTLALIGYEDAPFIHKIETKNATETEIITTTIQTQTKAPESTTTESETTVVTTIETPPPTTQPPAPVVSAGEFVFTTYGYGHGVGLSQNGANFYANYSGYNYRQILEHYFPGITISNTGTAQTEQITVDGITGSVMELLPKVVHNEVSASMNYEAIKAQAVAAYTYIKYNGNNGRDLWMKENPPQIIIDACAEVLGEACYYNGSLALTMFYASSGGATASCKDVFTQDIPYLRSTSSEYDETCDGHYGTLKVMSSATVKEKLESKLGITLSDNPENWISIIEGDGGYAAYVVVDGKVTIKGNTFRAYLGLKSPKFTYSYSE